MIALEDQIKCVRRELAQRAQYYPNLVRSGRLREDQAQREIDTMQAVLDTLERCRRADTNEAHDAGMRMRMSFEDEKN